VVIRALGNVGLNKVVVAKVDSTWKPIEGTEIEFPVDTAAVGYSLMPSVELARLCGCQHHYDDSLGYWKVVRNDRMETTVPGIFVAGDGVRIKGYAAAINEGKVAGIEVCSQLDYLDKAKANQLIRPLMENIRRAAKFGKAADAISSLKPGILNIISDDTIVCRCEEVTMGEIRTAVAMGARGVNDIKRRTRLGMGHCQGRYCTQVINELLWKLSGEKREREFFTPRIPVKAVPFEALLE
jgi:NAD(P)H-nitrite reductase large subunit